MYFKNENRQLKEEIAHLQNVFEGNLTEIKKDITDIRIHQGHTDEEVLVLTGEIIREFFKLYHLKFNHFYSKYWMTYNLNS